MSSFLPYLCCGLKVVKSIIEIDSSTNILDLSNIDALMESSDLLHDVFNTLDGSDNDLGDIDVATDVVLKRVTEKLVDHVTTKVNGVMKDKVKDFLNTKKADAEKALVLVEDVKATIEEAKDKVEEAKEKVEEAVKETKDKAEEAKEKVEEVKDKVEEAKEKVEEAKEKVEEAVKEAVKETVKETKEVVNETKADAKEAVKEAVNETKADAKEAVKEAKEEVKEAK
jgi:DNA anti-recombination protein RmuC